MEKDIGTADKYVSSSDDNGSPKPASFKEHVRGRQFSLTGENEAIVEADTNQLKRNLKGRHMQMIAIGGAIGAGLFVGSGKALSTGGPGSLVICFIIIGIMLLMVMQALGELAVMYPVNGAFCQYIMRFIDPSWGFATGWEYAIQWLTILPFEITTAGITISFWRPDLNIGIWVAVFLVALSAIQFFGVKGYGETEFILAIIKILGCIGFIIFGIVVDCGGVPTDNRGYLGAHYWHDPGAFRNGFKGFCSVFVTASFAFGGTELTGLAAAEAANPLKAIPKATRQVFWRITFFYVVNLFILGLIVPSDSDVLLGSSGGNTKASPFVLAIVLAGVKGLPSVFNVIITMAVLSVANSATYASTRTIQALAQEGLAPKFLAYVDKKGRPIPTIILQLLFGLLAFAGESGASDDVFTWLLSISGLANFFIWGSICIAHIRFRSAWKYRGHGVEELPYRATFGVWGSYLGALLNFICLAAQFYVAVWPIGGSGGGTVAAEGFFEAYLAAPILLVLYLGWKIYSFIFWPAHRPLWVATKDIDVYTGMRADQKTISDPEADPEYRRQSVISVEEKRQKKWYDYPVLAVRSLV